MTGRKGKGKQKVTAKKVTAAKKTSPGKDGTPCRARNAPAPALATTPGKSWTVKFTCHECGMHFNRFANYEKHMTSKHPACPRKPTDGPARDPTPTVRGAGKAKADAKTKAKGKSKAIEEEDDDDEEHDHDGDGDADKDKDQDDDDHDDKVEEEDDNSKGKGKAGPSTSSRTSKGKKLRSPTPDGATLFRIFRLIRNIDKAKSLDTPRTFKLIGPGSKFDWGEFLLDLTPDMADLNPNIRSIDHHEARIAKRMLQRIDLPWRLEEELEFTTEDDGTPMLMANVSENIPVSGRHARFWT